MSIKALERHLMPLIPFLNMDGVTEICLNQPKALYIEKQGLFTRYEANELEYSFLEALDPQTGDIKNGTLTLIESEFGIIGITCAHVVDYYLDMVKSNSHLMFQIGLNVINLQNHIIDYDKPLDLVTLRIDPHMLDKMKGETVPEMASKRVTRSIRKTLM